MLCKNRARWGVVPMCHVASLSLSLLNGKQNTAANSKGGLNALAGALICVRMRMIFALLLSLAWPLSALAHPHIFIEASLRLVISADGQFEAIEVTWTYDDLYSLLVLEDLGLDTDYDGELSDEERAKLEGFDLEWVADFKGDTYVSQDGVALDLGAPRHLETSVSGGIITTRHSRSLQGPAMGALVQIYDPSFYTAYEVGDRVEVEGGCWAVIHPADIESAYDNLEEILFNTPSRDQDTDFPEVGESFADKVMLKC